MMFVRHVDQIVMGVVETMNLWNMPLYVNRAVPVKIDTSGIGLENLCPNQSVDIRTKITSRYKIFSGHYSKTHNCIIILNR